MVAVTLDHVPDGIGSCILRHRNAAVGIVLQHAVNHGAAGGRTCEEQFLNGAVVHTVIGSGSGNDRISLPDGEVCAGVGNSVVIASGQGILLDGVSTDILACHTLQFAGHLITTHQTLDLIGQFGIGFAVDLADGISFDSDGLGVDGEGFLSLAFVVTLQGDLHEAVGFGIDVLAIGHIVVGTFRQNLVAVLDGDGGFDSLAVIAVGASHALDGGGDLLGGDGHFQLSLGAILQRQIGGEGAGIDPVALVSHSGQGVDAGQRAVSLDSLFGAVIDSAAIQGQSDLSAVSATAVDAGTDDLRAGSGIAPVMGAGGVRSVRVVGVLPLGIGAGGIAVVNRRAVQGRDSLHGLTVVQILAPDTAQQVSHLAGDKGCGGLILNIGYCGSTRIIARLPHQCSLVGVAVSNRYGAIEPASDAAASHVIHLSHRPAVFRQGIQVGHHRLSAHDATGVLGVATEAACVPAVTNDAVTTAYDTAGIAPGVGNGAGIAAQLHSAMVLACDAALAAVAADGGVVDTAGDSAVVYASDAAYELIA